MPQTDRPVVAGVYPLKNDGWPATGLKQAIPAGSTKADFRARHAMYPAVVRTDALAVDADGLLDVLYAPTGFMLIKREVFFALMQRFPELHCRSKLVARPELGVSEPGAFLYAFFDTMIDPESRMYLSEDYARSNLRHQGTAVYDGDLARSLEMQRAVATHAAG